jgi:orf73
MTDLFNSLVLQEATPSVAKKLNITPDEPPDVTQSRQPQEDDHNQQTNQPPQQEEQPQETQNTPPQEETQQEDDQQQQQYAEENPEEGNAEEDYSSEEGGEEVPAEDGAGEEEGLEGPTVATQEDPLDQAESEVFSNLKPEQFAIRIKTLKNQYKNLHSTIVDTLDQMNKLTKTSYDSNMIEFATRRLLELKDNVRDALVLSFPTRTYVENEIELQKATAAFNQIYDMINIVYDSRLKRAAKYNKQTLHTKQLEKTFDLTSETDF